jgi:fermentation-respiration switch protein FrsA (DUF1100 family)
MFEYFPGAYVWSHAMLLALGSAPWGGGALGEIDRVGAALRERVGDAGAWHDAWRTMAAHVEERAGEAARTGWRVSAADTYLRAAHYYLLAERFLPPADARKAPAYDRALHCFAAGAARLDPRPERVEVPCPGGNLPAWFVPAQGARAGRVPAVIFFDGLDATKEQLYLLGARKLAQRGLHVLAVDAPGYGEALRVRGLHLRPDYEVPGTACYEYLAGRPDVDPQRIGVLGVSLGGYYAPRAAAFEPRLAACAAWGAQWDYHAIWQGRLAAGVDHTSAVSSPLFQLMWVLGVDTPGQALEALRPYRLEGVAQRIRCPAYILHGADDRQIPVAHAQALYGALGSADKTLKVLTAAEGGTAHCQLDHFHIAHYHLFDWLADRLGA